MKFRKKPVVIEALQFDGSLGSVQEICDWANPDADEPWVDYVLQPDVDHRPHDVMIHTLEGEMSVSVGDWVIKGVKGEFYPIKEEIFRETYEPVE
ncbi:MAG TPA: hypothetical protein VEA41_03010 [Salinarimonas sp.]|nr:hypothetical protein [Salinarimonas sp.]